ncbi:zinc finger protein 462-like isoform X1 [Seriola aureovittata]|uniref:zinc finger protein 462-like isoform X1 n=1 Tax=Seriola aureovittata TaxID=2871759 RepID=UPI0024BDAD78|nr:zinc finger protein 462-like isoform X1 [Seriola aureovittata]
MQKDSMHFSTSGHMTHNQAVAEESSTKTFRCSHCMLIFKSKVYLFEHLNKMHDLDVDTALRDAGLKHHESNKANTSNQCNSSGNHFSCQHCDFKACSQDILNEHEQRCCKKTENQNGIVNSVICENQETKIIVISTEQPKEGAEAKESPSVKSTSKTKCTLNSSKDLKTYKRPLQTITKYFAAASGSQGKPSVNSAESIEPLESTKGTLILQESPSSSSPHSSGVFKVTAKSIIDISKKGSDRFLLNDHLLIADLTPSKPKEQVKEPASNNIGKRANSESPESCPAKKAKSSKKTTNVPEEASKQQSPNNTDFSFEISEDEEEKMAHLLNGDTESPKVYFCKHCDYSDMGLRSVSTHYQNDHPYIRYNVAYIQDPSDQSATFRCLECPLEFLSIADLKRHYTETHPDAPKVLTMQSCELSLVFKCFVCPFTTNVLKPLKEHYKEKHPKHKMDNPLLYCRYSATRYQEGSSQLNTCERAHSPERSEGISSKHAHAQKENVKKTPAALPPNHNGAEMVLYHCNKCKFSHKSIVVMHVHYQKSHPKEAVTIDKIKQSVRAISHITSETIPEKSVTVAENSAPQKNISDSSKKVKDKAGQSNRKISLSLMNLKHTSDSSKTHSESPKPEKVKTAEDRGETKTSPTKFAREISATMDSLSYSSPNKMFYCQFCCYSSTNIRSVVAHHKAKHAVYGLKDTEEIVRYSAEVQRKRQGENEASASTTSPDPETSKQVEVCSEKELPREQDNVEDASMMKSNPYACPENLFYCQKCNFGNPTVKGVLNHQATVHQGIKSNRECILEYTALIRDEIEKSKSNTEELPPSTHLPLPLLNEGDKDMVFCPLCNYRQNSINHVLKHCFKRHRGFEVKAEKIHMYTSVVVKQAQKLDLKTTASQEVNHASVGIKGNKKMLSKGLSVSASPSVRATQAQRTLKCHKCAYSSQYLNVLRRHMWKSHRTNRSVNEVLRLCFKRGMLESGYYCDLCVFSHKTAAAVYKHHQEQHPKRKLTFEYISTRLYAGPDTPPPEEKKPKIKQTDGTSDGACTDGRLQSGRSGQSENKRYSCRACSFRSRSMSSMADHYRAVHPWTVKEDGSVLNVITSKKPNANSHVEDHNEMPGSSDTQEVPPEFGKSPDSSREATESLTILKCHHCPATFHSQRGLKTHRGMKHPEAVTEDLYEQEEQRVQIQKRVHIFKCPHCTYVNTNYHGILTHCQMKHLSCVSRADSLHVNEKDLRSWEDSLKRKGPGESLKFSGYMCKTCPQIYATLAKINKHCENDHKDTVPNAGPSTHKLAPTPSAASKILQSNTHSSRASLLKASFLSKKNYTRINCQHCRYTCSTKIALSQHFHAHHSSSAVPKAKEYGYKCVLCPRSYFRKKRLGNHYILKHGKDAFFKYYGAISKQISEKSVLTSPVCPLTQRSKTISEVTESITTTEEDKVLVYMCPSCPYVNASHHGTLTHCQMKHPVLTARADELKKERILVTNMVGCTMGKGSNERGYMCRKCPQIYSSLEKLKIHGERDHSQAEPAASEHSSDTDTEKQPHHSSEDLVLEAAPLKDKTSAVNTTDTDLSQQLASPETCQVSEQNKEFRINVECAPIQRCVEGICIAITKRLTNWMH